ncbi:DUF928 domain-containing protein [Crocosphaera sp.]|uniref:DUF928 domain-containing protein n=1 Tax=Crocosphaera sp. TaxID=2729996 RepID=UPI003F20F5EE|nr:DUF928 domain-containing protein [Crocosphaera sp.]
MFNQKPIKRTIGGMTLASLMLLCFSSIGVTQTVTGNNNPNPQEESLADSVPDRRRGGASRRPHPLQNREENEVEEMVQAPDRRKPAASRNDNQCNFNPQQLIALIPKNLRGKTTADSPRLYFSVPAITPNTEIEFVLRGTRDELVGKQTFSGPGRAGIMSLQLPKVPRLSASSSRNSYHWYLSVICNPNDRADDVVVEGLLQPVALPSHQLQQLEGATLEERLNFYQSYDLWHERLDTLASLRRSQPQNSRSSQQLGQLLQSDSVQLDPSLGQQPLLETQRLSLNR